MIYILTDGDYSDYHIIGAFTDKTLAEKAQKVCGGQIEEFESNQPGEDGRFRFAMYFRNEDGRESVSGRFTNRDKFYPSKINEVNFWESKPKDDGLDFLRGSAYQKYRNCYAVDVMAEDLEHAIKIASDLVAQYKALNNKG